MGVSRDQADKVKADTGLQDRADRAICDKHPYACKASCKGLPQHTQSLVPSQDAEAMATYAGMVNQNQAFHGLQNGGLATQAIMDLCILKDPPDPTQHNKRSVMSSRSGSLLVQDAVAMATYADMVDQIKAFHGLQDRGLAQPPKIIIAERPGEQPLSQRVLTNGHDVAEALELRGFDAQASWSAA